MSLVRTSAIPDSHSRGKGGAFHLGSWAWRKPSAREWTNKAKILLEDVYVVLFRCIDVSIYVTCV